MHHPQKTSSSCVQASLVIAFSLRGITTTEDDFKENIDGYIFNKLPPDDTEKNWGKIPWLGKYFQPNLDSLDYDGRIFLQSKMTEKDSVMILVVSVSYFGAFLERIRADLSPNGALWQGQHHAIVAQPTPLGAGLYLWDPWSGERGQPFEVSWDHVWALGEAEGFGFVGVLKVYSVQEGLRVPSAPGDRV